MSTLCSLAGAPIDAHEVEPTVADLSVNAGRAELTLRLNIEAFLAGVDLDGITDTDDAANAEDYDALRALSEAEIAERLPALLEAWNALPLLQIDGVPVELNSIRIDVPEDIDLAQPRMSEWVLQRDIGVPARSARVSWPHGGGAMVLRQQGVEEPYTGYLEGGSISPEILFPVEGSALRNTAIVTGLLFIALLLWATMRRFRQRTAD